MNWQLAILKKSYCIIYIFLGKMLNFSHYQGLLLMYEVLKNIKEQQTDELQVKRKRDL